MTPIWEHVERLESAEGNVTKFVFTKPGAVAEAVLYRYPTYSARVFDPAGQDDVGGGCGQLHYVQQWFRDHPEQARPSIGASLPIIHSPKEAA